MTFHASVNTSHLYSYEDFYKSYEPKKIDSLDHRVHELVGRLINAQFKTVKRFEDITVIGRKVEDLIRQLKAEFDCVNIELNDQKYPYFIRRLEGDGAYPELADYHYYIVELLKLMLFRIDHSDSRRDIENQIKEFIIALTEKYDPQKKLKPLFKDKKSVKQTVNSDMSIDVKSLIQQQLDIIIDN
jgi:hypothetical protein